MVRVLPCILTVERLSFSLLVIDVDAVKMKSVKICAMSERSSYHHGDLRSALLDAAQRLIARDGVGGFTLRACAREAGVSHAAPAHHFGDVRGLLTALATQAAQTLGAAMTQARAGQQAGVIGAHGEQQAEADDGEPERVNIAKALATQRAQQRLEAIGLAYVSFALQHPGLFELLFRADLIDAESMSLQLAQRDLLDQLDAAVSELFVATKTFDQPVVPRIVLLWSFVHGLSSLLLGGNFQLYRGAMSPAEFARAMLAQGTQMLWPGLTAPASAAAQASLTLDSDQAYASPDLGTMLVMELKRR